MTILYLILVLGAVSMTAVLGFLLACAVYLVVDKVNDFIVSPSSRLSFGRCFPAAVLAVASVLIIWSTSMTSLVVADSGVTVAVITWVSMFLLGGFALIVPLVVAMLVWLLTGNDRVKLFDPCVFTSTFSFK